MSERWVSLNQLAEEVGLSVRTLQYMRAQEPGVLTVRERKGKPAEYLQPACSIALRKREVEKALKESAPAVSLDEARTRKALAEAELAELEVERARGQWVSVADSGAALGRALDLVCARLRTLGSAVASHGAAVEAAVEREAERLIEELHRMDEDVLDEPADDAKEAA